MKQAEYEMKQALKLFKVVFISSLVISISALVFIFWVAVRIIQIIWKEKIVSFAKSLIAYMVKVEIDLKKVNTAQKFVRIKGKLSLWGIDIVYFVKRVFLWEKVIRNYFVLLSV